MTTNSQLTLGPFIFEGLEVPERIVLKSRQRVIVHHLGSGASAMDSLGEDPQSITFQGTFTGPNTANRIRSIDHLPAVAAKCREFRELLAELTDKVEDAAGSKPPPDCPRRFASSAKSRANKRSAITRFAAAESSS